SAPLSRSSLLSPYTTLFRSVVDRGLHHDIALDLADIGGHQAFDPVGHIGFRARHHGADRLVGVDTGRVRFLAGDIAFLRHQVEKDRKSTRLNSSHVQISYAV